MTHSVVIAGATGMIGRLVLELCLAHPAVSAVTAVGRRPTGLWHDKLREVAHSDFGDCRPVADALAGHDVAHFCVGVYTGVVPDAELRRVTVDCAVGFAAAVHAQSPQAAFCLLSGQGADRQERSRVAFARYKGMAENGILQLGFARTHLFRPGYIYPVTPRAEPNAMYRAMRTAYPVLRRVLPNIGVTSEEVARAMVRVSLDGSLGGNDPAIEHREIRRLGADPLP